MGINARRLLAVCCALTVFGAVASGSLALEGSARGDASELRTKRPDKLDPALRVLLEEKQRRGFVDVRAHRSAAELVSRNDVAISAVPTTDGTRLLDDLRVLGLRAGVAFPKRVTGRLPIDSIEDAERLGSLQYMRPERAVTNVGAAETQGDHALRADTARSSLGVDGSGVAIGSLSDSFNCLGGANADVSSGDLPPGVTVLAEGPCPQTDEGRAMMQLIHDVAPGSSELFATAANGEGDFANQIIALKNAGAEVINDDVSYLNEPMFQDGVVAQAVDVVGAAGVAYFSAAGNEGRDSYEAPFRDSGMADIADPSGRLHDFDPGPGVDVRQRITIPAGTDAIIVLQWDDPFGTVPGSPGPQTDLDFVAFSAAGFPIAVGALNNSTTLEPVEIIDIPNLGAVPLAVDLEIDRFSGPNPTLMKWVAFTSGAGLQVNEFATNSATAFGHANATRAFGVAASFWGTAPAFGGSPATEPFSSAGGTPILFSANGQRLASPVTRPSPAFTGPDGGNTTFFGQDIPQDADNQPNFLGTSAAAPHVAGVAALALDQAPSATPAQIGSALSSTAVNIGPPGFDADSGAGLVDADAALRALGGSGPGGVSVSVGDVTGKEGNRGTKIFGFVLSLSSASTQPVTVRVSTRDGTARAGSDYRGVAGQVVTFAPGQTTASVDVSVLGDKKKEHGEQFFLDIVDAQGASVTRSQGTGTIRNDDRRR